MLRRKFMFKKLRVKIDEYFFYRNINKLTGAIWRYAFKGSLDPQYTKDDAMEVAINIIWNDAGGGCLPFKLSELKHEKEEISRKKYVIFDRESYLWQMVYCNNHKPDEETLKDIAKSMVSLQYCGKFSSDGSVCMNGGGIKNDSNIFVMSENGVQYLWQLGSKVSDMEGFIVPHLYYVRKIGMIV